MKGHIAKKKTGDNAYRYYPVIDIYENGKRRRKWLQGCKTKKEAQAILNEKLADVQKGTYLEPSKMTFAEFLLYWLETAILDKKKPRTYETWKYLIESHIIPGIGRYTLEKLNPLHIQEFYNCALKHGRLDGKGGLSGKTVSAMHTVIFRALKQAEIWQLLQRNVAGLVERPKIKHKEMKTWDFEQVSQFLDTIAQLETSEPLETIPHLHAMYITIFTGLRRGEVCALRWSNIDFENATLSVSETAQRIRQKGIVFGEPKTTKSQSSISLAIEDLEYFTKIRRFQAQNKLRTGPYYQEHNLVCAKPDGRPLEPAYLVKVFKRVTELANLPHIRFHDLRHTHATLLYAAEKDLKLVQERLRHTVLATTADIYTHMLVDTEKKAIRNFHNRIASTKSSTELGRSK